MKKTAHKMREKERGENTEETFRCVRPERVNKWPKSVVANWWWR